MSADDIPVSHKEPEKPLVYEPPDLEGRKHVAKVASDFRMREDECLADRLQNEEFEYHFGQNKSERWIGKIDIKKAKEIYLQEVENAGLLSKEELNRLCKDDQFLAEEVEKRMSQEKHIDSHRQAALEMQDEEFARYLEQRERLKYEEERKKRIRRKMEEEKASGLRLRKELSKDGHAGDNSDDMTSAVSEMRIKGDRDPAENWSVECESALTSKTKKVSQERNDKEIARALQLKEVQLQKKKSEEERDRILAMRLQKQEAEEYHRAKKERDIRRAHSERKRDDGNKHYEERHHNSDSNERRYIAETTPTRSQSEKSHRPRERHNIHRQTKQSEEQIYLKAVDSPSHKNYADHENSKERKRADHQPIDREKTIRQQEEIYRQAQSASRKQTRHKEDDKQTCESRNHQRPKKESGNDRRLIDDQMMLRQHARDIAKTSATPSPSNNEHKNDKRQQRQWQHNRYDSDLDPDFHAQNRPRGHAPRSTENLYDKPEENNAIDYNNIARNIDPTYKGTPKEPDYQTIGPPNTFKGHVGSIDIDSRAITNVAPVPVIPNVKRSSRQEEKKKSKKWFK